MSKVAVVYWSGTGHTQAMAEAVAKAAGADLITAAEFGPDQVPAYDAIAFGCPAMVLACESVICQDEPDDDALAACEKLGEALK